MKTRRILAASTAALLSFASVAVVASAAASAFDSALPTVSSYEDIADMDTGAEELNDIGGGVSIGLTDAAKKKLGNYAMGANSDSEAAFSTVFTYSSGVAVDGIFANLEKKSLTSVKKAVKLNSAKDGIDSDFSAQKFQVFNIDVTYGTDAGDETFDSDITLGAKVLVKIESSVKGELYHLSGDGKTIEKVNAARSKGINDNDGKWYYTFETNKFSPFVVADFSVSGLGTMGTAAGDFVTSDDVTSDPEDASSAATSDGTTSPDTGIALAIAPVVLAAGAVAVVALKKKH